MVFNGDSQIFIKLKYKKAMISKFQCFFNFKIMKQKMSQISYKVIFLSKNVKYQWIYYIKNIKNFRIFFRFEDTKYYNLKNVLYPSSPKMHNEWF